MLHKSILACLTGALCATAAIAQARPQPDATSTSGPSAWVYVASEIGTSSKSDVYAFTAAADGTLTPISGSPVSADVRSMAVNGVYLFGAPYAGSTIDSYKIESNGSLHYAASTDASTPNKCTSGPGPVFLDHTGATLYDFYYWGDSICSNSVYQSWNITKSSGALTYSGSAGGSQELTGPLTFSSNNQYAYTSSCYHSDPQISGFKRNSNGTLTELSATLPFPPGGWCPYLAAADPSGHLAVPMFPCNDYGCNNLPYQLATYTIQSDGNIATSSTSSNMPATQVGYVTALAMSPSGKLLAVAGTNGLQVFHFNGSGPITALTGLMSKAEIDSIFWDNNNHLYAIGTSNNKLAVFKVTPTSWGWVGGYTVNKPVGLAVQPLPLPWQ